MLFADEVANPLTLAGALVAGFAGMLALQTWIIRFLLTDMRAEMKELREAINAALMGMKVLGREVGKRESKTVHQPRPEDSQ